jgi:thymidylate kinase
VTTGFRAGGHELRSSAALDVAAAARSRPQDVGRRGPARRLPRTRILALSGLDGAGKSSQSHALRERLEAQGVEVEIYWLPLGHNPVQRAMRGWVRRLTRRARPHDPAGHGRDATPAPSHGSRALEHGPLVVHAWVAFVVLSYALSYRLALARRRGRGRVLVFDRYILDAIAQIRYFYGRDRRFGFQRWLLRALSPRPFCAYLLDVPASTALARKQEQFDLEALELQADLLREEAARLGVRRLDGEQPYERLLEDILTDVSGGRP